MNTLDSFLLTLNSNGIPQEVPNRDKRILNSLSRQIKSGVFLTEHQGALLVKIFNENKDYIPVDLTTVTWSQSFRKITQVRKIYLTSANTSFVVEFTFNKRIKQVIADLSKKLDKPPVSGNSNQYIFELTERNIFVVLDALKSEKFVVAPELTAFYTEIKEIVASGGNPFVFDKASPSLLAALDVDASNPLLIKDRSIRFQHYAPSLPNDTLSAKIANRSSTRVFVNEAVTSLADVVSSLKELDRFPILLVFNHHDSNECVARLSELTPLLQSEKTGIYFRFEKSIDSASSNDVFNSMIKDNGLNSPLTETTAVAGISNNQLPKFFFKTDWYPKSVISFSNNFKSNKASAFCDAVDLIVYYNKYAPLSGNLDEIV